jgi:hypothetical protein
MRKTALGAGLPVLVLAAVVWQFTPPLHAQSQSQDPSTQQQRDQQQPDQQQPDQKAATFLGQIVKAKNGQYALLTDKQAGKGYYLDDQKKAQQFDGQNVKVVGTLDVASNTIHVTDIQPA